ncbi:MAG: DUF3224 family protein [Acidimicrobiia bacterium]|nr:DUF3224 family protein [Acidimicrobiia bacterium]
MPCAVGTLTITSYDEDTWEDLAGGGKLARVSVRQALPGDVTGEGCVEWLVRYLDDGSAKFVGLQRISGSVAGRSGNFVVSALGVFDGNLAEGTWTVLDGLATDELAGMSGAGHFYVFGMDAAFDLAYDLE